jgi:hypothetical protein
MSDASPTRIVRPPTREQMREAYDLYTAAIGRVAYTWNHLHEALARLFARIVGGWDYDVQRNVALAVWYSSYSDRSQRQMLKAAIKAATHDPIWAGLPDNARADLLWLMEQANNLGNKRDEAIHAPCSFFTDHEGTEVGADFLSRHRRARSLTGKQLLIEFDWLERYTEALYSFTQAASLAMSVGNPTWPQRPSVPNRRPRKILQGRLRRLPLE